MILTITLNPSMDYVYYKDTFELGGHNRVNNPTKMPGGKGINASRTILLLNGDVLSFNLLGGDNGKLIAKYIQKESFNSTNLFIEEDSRNAITIIHDNGKQTEIVEKGPYVDNNVEKLIFSTIKDIIQSTEEINIVSINGTVNSDNKNFYYQLLTMFKEEITRNLIILMDLSQHHLKNIVLDTNQYFPDFIKPNIEEFGELVGHNFTTKKEILHYLKNNEFKIPFIVVSCGGDGAVAKVDSTVYDVNIPKINVVNPTGSGDATVGGIAFGFQNNWKKEDILKWSMACGIANTMEKGVGVVDKETVKTIIHKIHLVPMN
ncbi:hypothetical protein C7H83_03730 [Tetragenococcus halophilus]|uniref:Tagatose-6-phosphate kinase n=1 Tax=Tetragenococcus halophilus TaxID=51669 RepID=A0A3G5FH10_TETHA|nr:1-phosphofructokinase family hexose kinase [Tetragenococcus halophilus]AYW49657.1 hypothetical protein C7H83_03730 [Tetragenococcus halophilus]GBD64749.1 hypothetical protein TEHD23766T_2176 [Tetragenococcus halophilus subsp. flandriensis]